MPYLVSTNSFDVEYPGDCPYCGAPRADTAFNQPFSKMDVGMIPGQVQSKTWKVMLPACKACANLFVRSRVGYFAAGLTAAVWLIGTIALPRNLEALGNVILAGLISAYLSLLVFRVIKLRAFKVVYVGKTEVVYSSTNKRYARDFATLNGTEAEEKAFLMRFS